MQPTASDPPAMPAADTAILRQPSGHPTEDTSASGTAPETVRQETLFSMTLGASDVGEPTTLRRGSSELMYAAFHHLHAPILISYPSRWNGSE